MAIDLNGVGDATREFLNGSVVKADTADGTIAQWIRADNLSAFDGINNEITSGTGLMIGGASGNPLAYLWDGSAEFNAATGLTIKTDGTWQFVALSAVAGVGITLYLGDLGAASLSSYADGNTSMTSKSFTTMQIGWDRTNSGREFNGQIAEAAWWSVGLTQADLTQMLRGFSPLQIRPDVLIDYLPLVSRPNPVKGAAAWTVNNSPAYTPHIPVIRPSRRSIFVPAAAAASAVFPPLMGKIIRAAPAY